jgi:lipopolysaccharide/colanic/teichoic acid biosynthesis glycosyltransferase
MNSQQVAEIEPLASGLGRGADRAPPAPSRQGILRVPTGRESAPDRALRPSSAARSLAGQLLSAREFEILLERERCLADRGTRRFSVLSLRRRGAEAADRRGPAVFAELAQQLSKRLRSTDLVGQLGAEHLEILLTDTEPAGAQVVATCVDQLCSSLALDHEQTIYVYPSVSEPDPEREQEGRLLEGEAALVAPASQSPMVDLWPLFDIPTPHWKRALDVLVSGCALVLLCPLFALIALAIRLDTPGPVIFRQWRAGRGGRPFVFFKFRSMSVDAEARRAELAARNEMDGPVFKIRDDPRITRVGRLLRRFSFDELPQLWNVLKGDISLVGPRSPTLDEVSKYERWQRRRLSVTGGITCTWQVSGRSQIPFQEWMRLDMRYVACRNVWLDLRLLLRTLPAVVSGRGAC